MAFKILALEMAGDQVRAAAAERTWDSFRLLGTFESARRAEEPDLAAALIRVVEEAGKPDIVVSALPSELVASRLLTLPFKDRRKLAQVVPFAIEEQLPFSIEDAIAAFTKVGETDDGAIALAAVVRRTELGSHLDLLGKAGLDPKTVTLGPLALAALLTQAPNRNGRGDHGPRLVMDIDEGRTSMVLLDKGGVPRALRTVTAGLAFGNGTPLAAPAASAIVTVARQTLLAHAPDLGVPDLLIAGPAAAIPAVRSEIAKALANAVGEVDDFDSRELEGFESDSLRFAVCGAMLFGESPVNPLDLLNFRQEEFAYRGRTADVTPLYRTAFLAAAMLIFGGLHVILNTATRYHRLGVLDHQIESLAAPAIGSHSAAEVPAILRAKIEAAHKQLHLMGSSQTSPLDVLLALSHALPPHLGVQFSDLQIDDAGIKVNASADSYASVDQAKKSLTDSGYFDNIQVNTAKSSDSGDEIDFVLSASLKENPGE
jgi:Tfp pilus assembly protein PilN